MSTLISPRDEFVPPKLQITAMMDMFTIIVFFLLFSFSEKPNEIDLDKALNLPTSNAEADYKDSVKLFLSKTHLKLDEKIVAKVSGDRIVDFDDGRPEASSFYQHLRKHREDSDRKHQDALTEGAVQGVDSAVEEHGTGDSHILFFADRDLPFRTINSMSKTAAIAGYPNFQFLVLEQ